LHDHCSNRSQQEFIEELGLDYGKARSKQGEIPNVDHSEFIKNESEKERARYKTVIEDPDSLPGYGIDSVLGALDVPDYLIKGVLNRGDLSVTFGDSGTMKSFVELDKVMRMSLGMDWYGHKVKEPIASLIVLGEGSGGYKRRIRAWLQHYKRMDGSQKPLIWVVDMAADLYNNHETLQGWVNQAANAVGQKIDHILIDTLNTNLGAGANESESSDIGVILNKAKRAAQGAAVTFVHHVGHGDKDRERGSYAIRGNMDNRTLITRDEEGKGNIITVESKKVKDGIEFSNIYLTYATVTLGEDSDGDEITSLAIIGSDLMPVVSSEKSEYKTKNKALFDEAYYKSKTGNKDEIKEYFFKHFNGKEEAAKKAFSRLWNEHNRSHLQPGFVPRFGPDDESN
jgi:hypothetical protein